MFDFTSSVIVTAGSSAPSALQKAGEMLREELARRTGLTFPVQANLSPGRTSFIIATPQNVPSGLQTPPNALTSAVKGDGFALYLTTSSSDSAAILWIVGGTPRAALFAVGRLFTLLECRPNSVTLPVNKPGLILSTSPKFELRGHQLGYRSTPNTYDAWNEAQFEQYIRDLIIFGANAIELIPTLDPLEKPTSIMPLGPWEMNIRLSKMLNDYDLDTWIWLPIEDGDASKPDNWPIMLERRAKLFESMVRLDHLFVPGGDPGDLSPQALMPFMEEMAKTLRKYHPKAQVWISPQGFDKHQRDFFYGYLREPGPTWLDGVVYGPWVADSLEHLRESVPARYKIRRYPDIGHSVRCEFPVPSWDPAFAETLGREAINPRPTDHAHIHNHYMELAAGSLTYSEGVNDDVNKAVWSARMWDPSLSVESILRAYGHAYFSPDSAKDIAKGILELEKNWRGPLLKNRQPQVTYDQWRRIWLNAGAEDQKNWRLQQAYFRALYDLYVQKRLKGETELEQKAMKILVLAESQGSQNAAEQVSHILSKPYHSTQTLAWRTEILSLGDMLWKSIGMQMSVPLYHADGPERGAVLDFLDASLNNRGWILDVLKSALGKPDEPSRLDAIRQIVHWTDPGAGGFYDDLGDASKSPHLVRGDWNKDPGFLRSVQHEFSIGSSEYRLSWLRQASCLYETPLEMHYTGLNPSSQYRLRVLYTGRYHASMILTANHSHRIHDEMSGSKVPKPIEFPLNPILTVTGELRLSWNRVKGRGCQVAEVWLVRD